MGPKSVTVICALSYRWNHKINPSVECAKGEPNGMRETHMPDKNKNEDGNNYA